jgi:hypothetical protein
VPRRADNLALDTDACKKRPAFCRRQYDVVAQHDVLVVILRFDICAEQGDAGKLGVQDDEPHAQAFQVLHQARVIGMVVRGELVGDGGQVDVHAPAGMLQRPQRARPPGIDQQARRAAGQHIIVGRAIAHVDDVHSPSRTQKFAAKARRPRRRFILIVFFALFAPWQ